MNSDASPLTSDPPSGAPSLPLTFKPQRSSIVVLVALWAAIYLAAIFTPPLLDDVDTIHAEAAREMVLQRDWVTLHTDGIRYLEKAPLMYWAVACSYEVFGVHDWSTRLPLMIGVLAVVLVVYALGGRYYGEVGGFYSALALLTCVGPYIFTRFEIPDVIVGLWLALGAYFFLRALDEPTPSRVACWGFAATCALNVMTKSLIGLVFPLATIAIYLLVTGNARLLLRLRLFSSSLVFLLLALPWHILAAWRNPGEEGVRGFLWFYFVNEQFLRYVNKRVPPGYDTVPLFIFWALLLVWLVPWTAFLPQAFAEVPHNWRAWRAGLGPEGRANLFFALWALVIVLFFSFSTRQEYYTIPALPAMALLVGNWLAKEAESEPRSRLRRAGKISAMVLLAIFALGSLVGLGVLFSSRAPAQGTDLAELLRKNPAEYDLALGHFLDLTPEAMGAFRIPLLGAVISLLLGSALNLVLRGRGRPREGNMVLALMMVGLLACVHTAFVTFSPILSSKRLADAIEKHYQPGDILIIDGQYHEASTLNFYTGLPLRVLHEPSGNLWYGSKFRDAPHVFETQASFDALWRGPQTVFLWAEEDQPRALAGEKQYLLARVGGKSIFTNRELAP
jgi:4-amino-4-deoxy-L-arabinose transferase-like glycosyltransferase